MRIGFLGAGNMASAILRGMRDMEKGCYDISEAAVRRAEQELGARGFSSGEALCAWADIVVLAVKPQVLEGAVRPLARGARRQGRCVHRCGVEPGAPGGPAARVAPLPRHAQHARHGRRGNGRYRQGDDVCARGVRLHPRSLFRHRRAVVVEERLFDAVTAVSGSGPAYLYMVIEAMADAGVREGLSRASALELAAQTALGSAKMVLESGLHPAALRDMVCSPGGTTIDAVCTLEEKGLRAAVESAVRVCAEKSRAMSKQ